MRILWLIFLLISTIGVAVEPNAESGSEKVEAVPPSEPAASEKAVEPTKTPPKPAPISWDLKLLPLVTDDALSIDSVKLIAKGKRISKWELGGTCKPGTLFQVSDLPVVTCAEDGKWKAEVLHRASNDIVTVNLNADPENKKKLRYLALWTPSDKTENVMRTAPAHNSVVQAYRDGKPVTFVDMEDLSRKDIVLRNHSPLLESASADEIEKVELFVSNGPDSYQVTLPLERANYADIPWELWGPKLEKPGVYEYRTTIWKGQRDYLGVLNEIELGQEIIRPLQLNVVALELFGAYQPSSSGTVYSVDGRWMPRYRFNDRWSLRFEAAVLVLKQSGGGIFPAFEVLTGPAYSLGKIDLLAGVGWQFLFSSISKSGPLFSGGALFYLSENTRKFLLRARGVQARYSYLGLDNPVHLLRVGLVWKL